MPRLPLELIYNTIELLEDNHSFLRAASLTSRSLRRASQRCLFKRLAVHSWEHCLDLTKFLQESPHVRWYVYELQISGDVVADMVDELNGFLVAAEDSEEEDAPRIEDAAGTASVAVDLSEDNDKTETIFSDSIADAVRSLCSLLPHVKTLVIENAMFLTWYTSSGPFQVLKNQITRLDLQECTIVNNDDMLSFISLFQNLEALNIRGSRISIYYDREIPTLFSEEAIVPPMLKSVSVSWTRFALTLAFWLMDTPPPLLKLDLYAGTPFFEVPRTPEILLQLFERFGPNLHHVTLDSRGFIQLEELEQVCREIRHQTQLQSLKLRLPDVLDEVQRGSAPNTKWIHVALQNVCAPNLHTLELEIVLDTPRTVRSFDWAQFQRTLTGVRFRALKTVLIRLRTCVKKEHSIKESFKRLLPGLACQGMLEFVFQPFEL